MLSLDEIKRNTEQNLEAVRARRADKLNKDIADLRSMFSGYTKLEMDKKQEKWMADLENFKGLIIDPNQIKDPLKDADNLFLEEFDIGKYYSLTKFNVPTKYTKTLEEFFQPFVDFLDISANSKADQLKTLVEEAKERAEKGGGVYGVAFGSVGTYINGWLFAYKSGYSPDEAFGQPEIWKAILGTIAHEKFGHGFLSMYSKMGEATNELEMTRVAIGKKFDLQTAENPMNNIRDAQYNLILSVSLITEEGWATWIGNLFKNTSETADLYSVEELKMIFAGLRILSLDQNKEVKSINEALIVLFDSEQDYDIKTVNTAIRIIQTLGHKYDNVVAQVTGQPLRYVIGYLLMRQAEKNLGYSCMPFIPLIAENIHIDIDKISLTDMIYQLTSDPRLNPDTRFAMISRLKTDSPLTPKQMAKQVNELYSFSIPDELK